MEIIVDVKGKPDKNKMCDVFSITLTEANICALAEDRAVKMGMIKRRNLYDSEIIHIIP